jgi:hypothetical protein
VFTSLGDTHRAGGHPGAARKAWEQALNILDRLEHPDASQIRDKLDSLKTPADNAVPGPGAPGTASELDSGL